MHSFIKILAMYQRDTQSSDQNTRKIIISIVFEFTYRCVRRNVLSQ